LIIDYLPSIPKNREIPLLKAHSLMADVGERKEERAGERGWNAPGVWRHAWLPELAAIAILACLASAVFWTTDLDMKIARAFYYPNAPKGPWPGGEKPFSRILYDLPPLLTAGLALAGTGAIAIGLKRRKSRIMVSYGALILLSLSIGPGLISNPGKRLWSRPRPQQLAEFGGERSGYARPFAIVRGGEEGKSFPCGHASVGFVFCVFWFIFRRRRPRLGVFFLCLSIVLGSALGFLRIVDGAHFLSDVILTGLICYLVSHVLYFFALRIPQREAGSIKC
jgi:lipid A 4'-phosphatase